MSDANVTKELIEFGIFSSPVSLHMDNFLVEKSLNVTLKLQKDLKNITFSFKKIQPCETTITINKTDIVCVSSYRRLGRTPNIRVDYFKWCRNYMTRKGKRQLMTLALLASITNYIILQV
jgi:hypothetical protein